MAEVTETAMEFVVTMTEEEAYQVWYLSYRHEAGEDQVLVNRVARWFEKDVRRGFLADFTDGRVPRDAEDTENREPSNRCSGNCQWGTASGR